jgi:hypothetical protein
MTLTKDQKKLISSMRARRSLYSWFGGLMWFLTFYGVPAAVLVSTQTDHLPQIVTNLLPALAWASGLSYGFSCVMTWMAIVIFYGMTYKGNLSEKEGQEACATATLIPVRYFTVIRQFVFGWIATIMLWASAYYIVGTMYVIMACINIIAGILSMGGVTKFVAELPAEEVTRLLTKPWKNKKQKLDEDAVALVAA